MLPDILNSDFNDSANKFSIDSQSFEAERLEEQNVLPNLKIRTHLNIEILIKISIDCISIDCNNIQIHRTLIMDLFQFHSFLEIICNFSIVYSDILINVVFRVLLFGAFYVTVFNTPWKHHKTRGILFSGGIEKGQSHEMGYTSESQFSSWYFPVSVPFTSGWNKTFVGTKNTKAPSSFI